MDRREFLFNETKLTYSQLYEQLKRADERLFKNLSNSFWVFNTFVGFHLAFIYTVISKQMVALINSNALFIFVITLGGTLLTIFSLMSMNKYRSHVQADEKVIAELEDILGDPQQKVEQQQRVRFPSGAGKARKYFFFMLWLTEIGIAILYALKVE